MENNSHDFTLNMQELVVITTALLIQRNRLDLEIAKAFEDHNQTSQRVLLAQHQTITDIYDMMRTPIVAAIDAWEIEERRSIDWDFHDEGDEDLVSSDDGDWIKF